MDQFSDRPPKRSRAGRPSLLKRIAKKQKKDRSARYDQISRDRLARLAKWTEWQAMGMSVPKIAEREKGQFKISTIQKGINEYLDLCADPNSRTTRLTLQIQASQRLKALAFDRIQRMLKSVDATGGKGLPIETEIENRDKNGNITDTSRRTTFDPPDKHLLPWMKFVHELNEHEATLQGIARGIEQQEEIETIDVSFDGFLLEGSKDDAEKDQGS